MASQSLSVGPRVTWIFCSRRRQNHFCSYAFLLLKLVSILCPISTLPNLWLFRFLKHPQPDVLPALTPSVLGAPGTDLTWHPWCCSVQGPLPLPELPKCLAVKAKDLTESHKAVYPWLPGSSVTWLISRSLVFTGSFPTTLAFFLVLP